MKTPVARSIIICMTWKGAKSWFTSRGLRFTSISFDLPSDLPSPLHDLPFPHTHRHRHTSDQICQYVAIFHNIPISLYSNIPISLYPYITISIYPYIHPYILIWFRFQLTIHPLPQPPHIPIFHSIPTSLLSNIHTSLYPYITISIYPYIPFSLYPYLPLHLLTPPKNKLDSIRSDSDRIEI